MEEEGNRLLEEFTPKAPITKIRTNKLVISFLGFVFFIGTGSYENQAGFDLTY